MIPVALSYEQIEEELRKFEESERARLGLEPAARPQWHDPNPTGFDKSQRKTTTILLGGLTVAQDLLIQAALETIGYRIEALDCPDVVALRLGKEFGNRGQCNPTYFTVGNLLKHLCRLRDEEGVPTERIVQEYVFLTAGACGPCRFGTYATEYRKALRDAGFDGFRVLLFQQMGGLKQATGEASGLEFNPTFFRQVLKAVIAGDVLNALGYRMRPYEIESGQTDRAIETSRNLLREAFLRRRSILAALNRCRWEFRRVRLDRLRLKPKVMIIGEFWAMTTEGDGNYHLQRFLESEGAEVDVQLVTAWLLYMIWQVRHDTRRRMTLRAIDETRGGQRARHGRWRLAKMWAADRALRAVFRLFASAIGLHGYHLPDMNKLAALAGEHYDVELRGGEGHMEVGKLIQAVRERKAHMVVSVKPFGCMPSSAVSDGIQSAVLARLPEAIFCPVETTGDSAVNFQSRILMFLYRARRKAQAELDAVKSRSGVAIRAVQAISRRRPPTYYPPHVGAGTAANEWHSVWSRLNRHRRIQHRWGSGAS